MERLYTIELPDLSFLNQWLDAFSESSPTLLFILTLTLRILSTGLAILVVTRCLRSLFQGKTDPETWAYLDLEAGGRFEICHWENVIGRAHSSDISIALPTVSRSHAALLRGENGAWQVTDLSSKSGTLLNGIPVHQKTPIVDGDILTIGGVDAVFTPVTPKDQLERSKARVKPGRTIHPSRTLGSLTWLQFLIAIQLCASLGFTWSILLSFGVLSLLMWTYFALFCVLRRRGFEPEILCFFLTTIGFSVAASSSSEAPLKQTAALVIGLLIFVGLSWILRDLRRATTLRWPMAAAALALLGINLIFGETVYGARNWLSIGGYTFQPSEFVKIAFVYAGGATLDRLFAKRNVYLFIAFTGVCIGALALMGDFGTASIFFAAFLVIVYLRSGDIATIALVCSGVVLGGLVILTIKPYIANRFAAWGHVWEFAHSSGYQQTRTMSAAASGGFLGFGPGNGWLKGIAAADTDLVFGMVCEELGLLIALCSIVAVAALALFAIKSASTGRSTFYVICACAASAMLVFQMMLNVFGSVDILPLTGVTFPFVSNGGTSLIACWGLLAFLKAADTRQNASFAVKLYRKSRVAKRTVAGPDIYDDDDISVMQRDSDSDSDSDFDSELESGLDSETTESDTDSGFNNDAYNDYDSSVDNDTHNEYASDVDAEDGIDSESDGETETKFYADNDDYSANYSITGMNNNDYSTGMDSENYSNIDMDTDRVADANTNTGVVSDGIKLDDSGRTIAGEIWRRGRYNEED